MEKNAQQAIYKNAHGNVELLKTELLQTVYHVFGEHSKCQPPCSNSEDQQHNSPKNSGLLLHLEGIKLL